MKSRLWLPPALVILLALAVVSCEKKAAEAPEIISTKSGIEMVAIPGGWFQMGSSGGEADESPVHKVWVDSFLMDRYEVTQEQYEKLIRGNPSHFRDPQNPVEQMSWAHAARYCNARSRAEGLEPCYDEETAECDLSKDGYRLPTEAEWEYACRAGSETDYHFGSEARKLKAYAWYAENSFEKTHPVGQKQPNGYLLYDMCGNVAEWCNDIYGENYYKNSPEKNPSGPSVGEKYVLRGGSWNSSADKCRSAYRVGDDPGFQDACFARDDIGFRCVRNAPADAPAKARMKTHAAAAIQYPAAIIQNLVAKTGLVYRDIYLQHKTGAGHPETPERLEAVIAKLKGLVSVRLGEYGDSPVKWIGMIHDAEYVKRVKDSCRDGVGYMDSIDTPISEKSYEVAVAAVGGVLSAIDAVMAGEVSNAFCAVRPPGHHATRDRAMGFCLFNNVAVGARYVQKKYGLSKVLIVDWDVHHGNATQDAFYDDPTVLYFSTHQFPFYPGTGRAEERGEGKGRGYNINVPMSAGCGDAEYKKIFEEILRPAAMKFKPEFVLISAGFDAHKDDPIGGMKVTAGGFADLTAIVIEIAEKCCERRIVSVLEGGYDLNGLAESAAAHFSALGASPAQ